MSIGWSLYLLLWLTWGHHTHQANTKMFTELYSVMNKELGLELLKKGDIPLEQVEVNWDQKASQAAAAFAETFIKHFNAVTKLRNAIISSHGDFSPEDSPNMAQLGVQRCCTLNDDALEFVKEVGKKGDTKKPCFRTTTKDADLDIPVTSEMIDSMIQSKGRIDDLNTTGMKWIYFGNEKGAYAIYPATRDMSGCHLYDPRVRPWYAVTASPVAKDIVIVLDMSELTASRNTTGLIKGAAKTVIDTLSPNDRESVDSQQYIQGNQFNAGIEKAFDLLEKPSNAGEGRKRAMLFMTDGPPQEERNGVLKYLRKRMEDLEHDVLVLTYGIQNDDLKQADKDLLENMTLIGNVIEKNRFTLLNNSDDLRFTIGRYYTFFAPNELNHPIVTVPYVDYFGLGLIVSICLPVYYSEDTNPELLQGVTCTDLTISDLTLKEMDIEDGYLFIFSHVTNRTLVHPLLPRPGDVAAYGADPVFLDIAILEPDAGKAGILDEMKQKNSGSTAIETTWITSQGSSARNGVKQQKIKANYYYRPIQQTDFTMAIVVPDETEQMKVSVQNGPDFYPKKVHYSSLFDNADTCNYYGAIVDKEITSIFLTPMAFTTDSSTITQEEMENYMQNTKHYNDIGRQIQDNVKEMIAVTARLEETWTAQSDIELDVIWKYIATTNGAMRIYPAVHIGHKLAFGHSDWFAKALDNLDGITITTPRYEDITGRTIVISLLKTVTGSNEETDTETTIAVIGMDISLQSMYSLVMRSVEDCRTAKYRCFLMDKNGYIIYHDNFLAAENISSILGGIHISQAEQRIAAQLIKDMHLKPVKCVSFGNFWEHSTWMMAEDFSMSDQLSTHGYKVEKMEGTNTYIVLVTQDAIAGQCECDLQESAEPGLGICRDDAACQCPCYRQAEFSRCKNEFSGITEPVCTPNHTSLLPSRPQWLADAVQADDQLPLCKGVMCDTLKSEWSCRAFSRCSWCPSSENCIENTACPDNDTDIVAIVVPIVVILLLIIVAVFVAYRCKQMGKTIGPVTHIPYNSESGGSFPFHNKESSEEDPYHHIPGDNEAPGFINGSYIHSIGPNDVFDAPGAPTTNSMRKSSCVGNSPKGPPPTEDFPPGSPQNDYLTMNANAQRPSQLPLAKRLNSEMRLEREKDGVVLDPVGDGSPYMHGGQVRDRQSMPLPPQPTASPQPRNASTLPRGISTNTEDGGLKFAQQGGGHGVVQPLYDSKPPHAQFTYAEFGNEEEDKNIKIEEMYITCSNKSLHSPTKDVSPLKAVPEDAQSKVSEQIDSDEENESSETVISVRL